MNDGKGNYPCRQNPDRWFSDDKLERATARHICLHHCAWLRQCREWARDSPPKGGVQAGVRYDDTGRRHRWQPEAEACGRCIEARLERSRGVVS